ncbi:hypothetical protein U9M48_038153 [Paspalum notatum var. saurae]|uniref:BPM/SPOP BACK domain-containing protein n=1 Tax=Paspalum notatum var. saurae TaxID=547442 RepID=A0AAQ3UGD7_PASNO
MYTGTLPEDDGMLQNLVAAADMYGMDNLKLMCAQKLFDRVSVETVVATMCFAETHGCAELKNRCMDFFMEEENFYQVVCRRGYFQLLPDYPSILDEIRSRLGSQTESPDEYFHSSPSEPGFFTF